MTWDYVHLGFLVAFLIGSLEELSALLLFGMVEL